MLQLFSEEIPFVQEQNHGRLVEPSGVADVFEKRQRFHHPILRLQKPYRSPSPVLRTSYLLRIFGQGLVVFTQGKQKKHRVDIIEAMYPFSSFRPLSADVNDSEKL